jgi:hypothetical protein
MQVHGNHRLSQLALRNAQRRNLEDFLRTCEAPIRALWEGRPLTFHPETPISVPTAYSRAGKIHDHSFVAPAPFRSRSLRTSSSLRAREWLVVELQGLVGGEYLATFGRGATIRFGPNTEWVPDLPITRVVPQDVLLALRSSEEQLAFDQLAMVALEGARALVLDSYAGILPDEPSAQEVVYELTFVDDAV